MSSVGMGEPDSRPARIALGGTARGLAGIDHLGFRRGNEDEECKEARQAVSNTASDHVLRASC